MDKDRIIREARRWGPRALPSPLGIVYASGAAELVCATGLARGARWATPASAALLVAVLPANVQMALDTTAQIGNSDAQAARRKAVAKAVAAWIRVPMQAPLVWAALQAGR